MVPVTLEVTHSSEGVLLLLLMMMVVVMRKCLAVSSPPPPLWCRHLPYILIQSNQRGGYAKRTCTRDHVAIVESDTCNHYFPESHVCYNADTMYRRYISLARHIVLSLTDLKIYSFLHLLHSVNVSESSLRCCCC